MPRCGFGTTMRQGLVPAILAVAIVVGIFAGTQVGAHFLLNLNVRIFHVDHIQNGLILHLRTPMPYLVADKLGEDDGVTLPEPAPFTTNARDDDRLVHYVNALEIEADPLGLGRIAEESLVIESNGVRLRGTVGAMTLHEVGTEPSFATLDEARAALSGPFEPSLLREDLYVGDTVVDITIRYEATSSIDAYSLSSALDPGLPEQEQTANLILDYGPGEPKVYRSRGLLTEAVEVSRSRLSAVRTFVWEGVRHILEGLDHVLFVVCLVIGATTLHRLLWRVTGFTIGHSVTLALGFLGYVPKGDWFVPAVETGIAVSIIYAGAIAFQGRSKSSGSELQMFLVTLSIGLLHGLGFSFVLQEILQVTSPNIWQSLLAFNVGVELGQLFIVLAIWPLLHLLTSQSASLGILTGRLMAAGCIGIAIFWTIERTLELVVSFGAGAV